MHVKESTRKYVSEKLLLLRQDIKLFESMDGADIGSSGMVSNYNLTGGGRSSKISDITSRIGTKLAGLDDETRKRFAWVEVVESIYRMGLKTELDKANITITERQRRATVSYILYYRSFLGCPVSKILEMEFPNGSKPSYRLYQKFWNMTIERVAAKAKEVGLIE